MLYYLGNRLQQPLKKKQYAISIITEIELLSYPNIQANEINVIQNLAEELGIELLYLPPYSPNLNLIERLWKFVKKKCLYAKYYEDFSRFSSAISDCLDEAHLKYKKELDSLLTDRFQTFEKSQILKV